MARMRESFKDKGSIKNCRAKLSDSNNALLSEREANLVRWLIRGSFVDEDTQTYFSPLLHFRHSLLNGHCVIGGKVATKSNSYGDAIVVAVKAGKITVESVLKVLGDGQRLMQWAFEVERTDQVRKSEPNKYIPEVHHVSNNYIDELRTVISEYGGKVDFNDKRERRGFWEAYAHLAKKPDEVDDNDKEFNKSEAERLLREALEEGYIEIANDDIPIEEVEDVPPPESKSVEDQWFDWLAEVRNYLSRGDVSQPDIVSLTTYKNGARMLAVGIPLEACKDAYAKTWPENMRLAMGVREYDPMTFGDRLDNEHRVTAYVEALIKADVMPFLVGHSQAGKSYIAECVAKRREIYFGVAPCTAGISPAWFTGRNVPNGFVGTDFLTCYSEGGVFLFDEIDAADSNILLLVNNALSNDAFRNPIRNETLKKSVNFHGMAAGNTFGLGADPMYTGRERLDTATLERFRMGRVFVDYDYDLYVNIARSEYLEVKGMYEGTEEGEVG